MAERIPLGGVMPIKKVKFRTKPKVFEVPRDDLTKEDKWYPDPQPEKSRLEYCK